MNIAAIRTVLAELIRADAHLQAYELPTGTVAAPAVLMGAPAGTYAQTMGSPGVALLRWPLVVIVSRAHPTGLDDLAEILGRGTDRSLPDALETAAATAALSQVCQWVTVLGWDNWEEMDVGGASFWSAQVNLEVMV